MSVIDFHSHIIPKGDHGCNSEQVALRQLKLLFNAGIGTVIATPHFYPNRHNVKDFNENIERRLSSLLTALPDKRPQIMLGTEVLIFENIDRMNGIDDLCIRGTKIMLLEMPMGNEWSNSLFKTVNKLIEKDITIVLAHIDRYLPKHKEDIKCLLDMGALAQINASSFKKFLFKKHLVPFLNDDRLVAFGTDIHGEDRSAVASFADLKKLKNDVFDNIMSKSEKLLKDAVIY